MSTPADMSTRQLVDALLGTGMNKAQIAEAVGRNSSVVSQITSGKKPYANLQPSLAALLEQRRGREVTVPQAPRRLNRQGQVAQVRRSTAKGRTVVVRSKGSIKSGARSIYNRLKRAAADGLTTAWTLVFQPDVTVSKSPKLGEESAAPAAPRGHRAGIGAPSVADFGGVPAATALRYVDDAGGDVPAGMVQYLVDHQRLDDPSHVPTSVEMRLYRAP